MIAVVSATSRRHRAVMLLGAMVWLATSLNGQPVNSLDAWLVSRFQGTQLLIDSMPAAASVAAESPLPRIESTRAGRFVDTLYAIHFGSRLGTPALAVNAVVQLTGPTGTITPLAARVIARRAFRAPRRPGAPSSAEVAWRYGWSYQAVLPHRASVSTSTTRAVSDAAPVARYRGWLLLAVPDTKSARVLPGR